LILRAFIFGRRIEREIRSHCQMRKEQSALAEIR